MFFVTLKLTDKEKVGTFMEAHKAWIQKGFDEGVFLAIGSLTPEPGGGILAHNAAREALEARVAEDPFVVNGVASPTITEVQVSRTDERLAFLKG
ncbi:MAG: hypothetical protein EP340_00535 [Alphaproteobacteria bacterium]|nr:MAG: hypothetical protein EP340_00535 [Alphaproteobacteria bacterium]